MRKHEHVIVTRSHLILIKRSGADVKGHAATETGSEERMAAYVATTSPLPTMCLTALTFQPSKLLCVYVCE